MGYAQNRETRQAVGVSWVAVEHLARGVGGAIDHWSVHTKLTTISDTAFASPTWRFNRSNLDLLHIKLCALPDASMLKFLPSFTC